MNTKLYTWGSASGGLRARNTTRSEAQGPLRKYGFVLPLVLVAVIILMALIMATTMTDYHARLRAVKLKSQTEAMLAAEAGYESAIFWMSQQSDILTAIQAGSGNGSINFGTSTCSYTIAFHGWLGQKPIYEVTSTGVSGRPSFTRIVDVNVIQETSGWAMGSCMIPNGTSSTTAVYFANGEIINMPININNQHDSPDVADIFITGSPTFLQKVEMGEDRYTSGGTDKYSSVMSFFQSGISFDQPTVRIADATAVQSKVTRFQSSTLATYQVTPNLTGLPATAPFSSSESSYKAPAVQLEFFVQGGVGMVRITNNCAVRLMDPGPSDYNCVTATTFHTYKIYGYHYRPNGAANQTTVPITNTYVTQTIGGYTSDPGGQIYVNGNVIIGGDSNSSTDPNQVVKGKITVVATGNIWIADSIWVDDNDNSGNHYQRDANGMPPANNPNILGLIAQGVIKVVDPGLSPTSPSSVSGYTYQPIGNSRTPTETYPGRWLPDPTVVEAAMTIGGGGWGAENVGSRRVYSGSQDYLIVHGSITEVIRGVVGHAGPPGDGYIKQYYIDTRLMSGILPGDIWLSGKYFPAPAGWHDNQSAD
jgi:hypothetical protein